MLSLKKNNIMQSQQSIKKRREDIRNKVKSNLKLPRMFGTRRPPCKVSSPLEKPVKLDKRHFQSVFKLGQKLGEGANGYVQKCTEIKTGLPYAVKVLQGDDEYVRIVKQTYQILKLFDHDCVIKGKCCFINENTQQIYLVMEYCQHPSLGKIMQTMDFTEHDRKSTICSILEAVSLLHQASVCHRDIKPHNILYDSQHNKVKIIDFGISKCTFNRRIAENQSMWTVTGTQYYKAPEMLNGSAYDEKVDVWAIGVIAYQLCFGRLPFYSEYASEIIEQILSDEPSYEHPSISSLEVDFLKALLRKDPKQRLSCNQALRHPWIEPPIRFKKSDDLSSSQLTFHRQQFFNRKFSPSISTLVINSNVQVNVEEWSLASGIIEIGKEENFENWISLRKQTSSEKGSFNESKTSLEYELLGMEK